ncbi:class I SAM-dependent methyltransferase [Streptomyces apocyni]|uniref:hypothetical protein n=1 Tax=Streptomyces apocyni TaxID=2654677 RepID=UPI002D7F49AA|nr:hypothetical protein [Streptomyces apocyni]
MGIGTGAVLGDSRRLPFPDGTFDAVAFVWVLQLVPEAEQGRGPRRGLRHRSGGRDPLHRSRARALPTTLRPRRCARATTPPASACGGAAAESLAVRLEALRATS